MDLICHIQHNNTQIYSKSPIEVVQIVSDSFNYDQPQYELRSISNKVNISHSAHIH